MNMSLYRRYQTPQTLNATTYQRYVLTFEPD